MEYTTDNTNVHPFYDDFDATKNYLRILFNPARSVQARELTQIQTLLQNQVSSFANHIFQDGSSVIGGEVTAKVTDYIVLVAGDIYTMAVPGDNQHASNYVTEIANISSLLNRHVRGLTSNAVGQIVLIETVKTTTATEYKLHMLMRGGTFEQGEQVRTENYGTELDNPYATHYISKGGDYSGGGIGVQSLGNAIKATLNTGIVYVAGMFIQINTAQTTFVTTDFPFTAGDQYKIGFEVTQTVIDFTEDDTLKDPANGRNYGAYGADRLKLSPTLVSYKTSGEGAVTVPEDFYEVLHIEVDAVDQDTFRVLKAQNKVQYADIIDMMARRTYDESGNYTVKPYSCQPKIYTETDFKYEISPGKSYVLGYENETISPSTVIATKGRDNTRYVQSQQISTLYGSYVDVASAEDIVGNIDPTELVQVQLHNAGFDNSVFSKTENLSFVYAIGSKSDVAITSAGSGYAVGDVLTLTTGTGTAAQLMVTDVDITGAILDFKVLIRGAYTVKPSDSTHTSSGGSTNASFSINYINAVVNGSSDWSLLNVKAGDSINIVSVDTYTILQVTSAFLILDPGVGTFTPNATPSSLTYTVSRTGYGINTGNLAATRVGYARVFFIQRVGSAYRVYLGDKPSLRSILPNVRTLYVSSIAAGDSADVYIKNVTFTPLNSLIRQTPITALSSFPVKTVSTVSYKSAQAFTKAVTAATTFSFDLSNDPYTSFTTSQNGVCIAIRNTGTGAWVDAGASGLISSISVTSNLLTFSAAHPLTTGTYEFYISVDRTNAPVRSKTLTKTVVTFTAAGSSYKFSSEGLYDIAEIINVIQDPNGTPVALDGLEVDPGQRDWYYDYGTLHGLSNGVEYSAEVWHYTHSSSGDYFTVVSYDNAVNNAQTLYADLNGIYANIPTYTNEEGNRTYNLRNCVDFRRNIVELTTEKRNLEPNNVLTASFEYYLPRKDKVWIHKNGTFGYTAGVPEEEPKIPPDQSDTMTLFIASVPAYVFKPDTINISPLNKKNYTMLDIHKLENRLHNLEYYNSLLQLRLDSETLGVKDAAGLPRNKNGIFVDPFRDHLKGEVRHPLYRNSMDYTYGILRCPYNMANIQMSHASHGTNISVNDNTITLAFTEYPYAEQLKASNYENINPYDVFVWGGDIQLTPASDFWVDTQWLPALQVNMPELAQSIRDLYLKIDTGLPRWGEWTASIIGTDSYLENIPGHGVGDDNPDRWNTINQDRMLISTEERIERGVTNPRIGETHRVTTTETQYTRTGTITQLSGTQTVTKDLGDRVVDVSQIPYMRSIKITFTAKGLKPNTVVVPYFGSVDVTDNCYAFFADANIGGDIRDRYLKIDGTAISAQDSRLKQLKTNASGEVSGTFVVPEHTFLTGSNTFSLIDRLVDPTTSAATEFSAAGILQTKQQSILSVEVPTYTTKTITESFTEITTDREFVKWFDPIAESFLVDQEGGIFLNSVEIFFAGKDNTVPVTLQIVEMVNGYPSQKVLPFGRTTVDAWDITATYYDSADGKIKYSTVHVDETGTPITGKGVDNVVTGATQFVPTKFTFSDPVYLKEGGEYAFVLLANSTNYEVYVAEMGGYDFISGERIVKQPYTGVMFKSQNASTWTADQNRDIMFRLNRCFFETDTSDNLIYLKTNPAGDLWSDSATYTWRPNEVTQPVVLYGDPLKVYTLIDDGGGVEYNMPTDPGFTTYAPDQDSRWSEIAEGQYDATLINVSVEEMLVSDTYLTKEYKMEDVAEYASFVNKADIPLTAKETVKLDTGSLYAPYLKLNARSDKDNVSPVLHRNRTSMVLVNNLVVNLTEEVPNGWMAYSGNLSTPPNWDAGKYVSIVTQLKKPSTSIRVLIDVLQPEQICDVLVKFRTTVLDKKEVTTTGTPDTDIQDNICYVYHYNTDAVYTSWEERSQVVVDGFDVTNNKVYLSSIGDYTDFRTNSGTQTVMITTEPDIENGEISAYSTEATYDSGEYVIYNNNLWVSLKNNNTVTPSVDGTDWEYIPSCFVDGTIGDAEFEWQPMDDITELTDDFQYGKGYVEREFKPRITPSEEFETFAVMIEMFAKDEVTIPLIKNLRAIAVE